MHMDGTCLIAACYSRKSCLISPPTLFPQRSLLFVYRTVDPFGQSAKRDNNTNYAPVSDEIRYARSNMSHPPSTFVQKCFAAFHQRRQKVHISKHMKVIFMNLTLDRVVDGDKKEANQQVNIHFASSFKLGQLTTKEWNQHRKQRRAPGEPRPRQTFLLPIKWRWSSKIMKLQLVNKEF